MDSRNLEAMNPGEELNYESKKIGRDLSIFMVFWVLN
jgi:hypothetical protein